MQSNADKIVGVALCLFFCFKLYVTYALPVSLLVPEAAKQLAVGECPIISASSSQEQVGEL